jgi:hypothetical protein
MSRNNWATDGPGTNVSWGTCYSKIRPVTTQSSLARCMLYVALTSFANMTVLVMTRLLPISETVFPFSHVCTTHNDSEHLDSRTCWLVLQDSRTCWLVLQDANEDTCWPKQSLIALESADIQCHACKIFFFRKHFWPTLPYCLASCAKQLFVSISHFSLTKRQAWFKTHILTEHTAVRQVTSKSTLNSHLLAQTPLALRSIASDLSDEI